MIVEGTDTTLDISSAKSLEEYMPEIGYAVTVTSICSSGPSHEYIMRGTTQINGETKDVVYCGTVVRGELEIDGNVIGARWADGAVYKDADIGEWGAVITMTI